MTSINTKYESPKIIRLLFCILAGIFIGVGGYTFFYARGYSYLTDRPEACINCHVMRDQYKSWKSSVHRSLTCNGCHVPHELAGKYLIKSLNGFSHSYAFTFENVQTIHAKPLSKKVLQKNCIYCHSSVVNHQKQSNRYCFDCHSETRHTN